MAIPVRVPQQAVDDGLIVDGLDASLFAKHLPITIKAQHTIGRVEINHDLEHLPLAGVHLPAAVVPPALFGELNDRAPVLIRFDLDVDAASVFLVCRSHTTDAESF